MFHLAAISAWTIALQEVWTHFCVAIDFDVRVRTVLVRAIAFQEMIAHRHLIAVESVAQKTVRVVAFALQKVSARGHFVRVMHERTLVALITFTCHKIALRTYRCIRRARVRRFTKFSIEQAELS